MVGGPFDQLPQGVYGDRNSLSVIRIVYVIKQTDIRSMDFERGQHNSGKNTMFLYSTNVLHLYGLDIISQLIVLTKVQKKL